jgi:flagellar biosynthesis protein FliR
MAATVINVASSIFSVGLRLAFPIVGLLFMTDIALAMVGRINSQLYLSMHAFPVKMLLTLAMLTAVLALSPQLYETYAAEVFKALHHSILP